MAGGSAYGDQTWFPFDRHPMAQNRTARDPKAGFTARPGVQVIEEAVLRIKGQLKKPMPTTEHTINNALGAVLRGFPRTRGGVPRICPVEAYPNLTSGTWSLRRQNRVLIWIDGHIPPRVIEFFLTDLDARSPCPDLFARDTLSPIIVPWKLCAVTAIPGHRPMSKPARSVRAQLEQAG